MNNDNNMNKLYAMSQNPIHYIYQFIVFRSILRYSMVLSMAFEHCNGFIMIIDCS